MEDDVPCGADDAPPSPALLEPSTNDQKYLKEFILNLEILPELWDNSSPYYKNIKKRNEALSKLLEKYKKIKSNASIDDVRKKINSLRSNYRKEMKKVVYSKRLGAGSADIYKPKSWVFYMLRFLDKTEQPITWSAPGICEELQQSESQQYNTTEQNSRAFYSINVLPFQKQRKKGSLARQNELLDKVYSFSSTGNSPSDNTRYVNPTAFYWSSKLDKLSPTQKLYAEKFINEILLEAELGNLDRNSVRIYQSPRNQVISPSPSSSPGPSITNTSYI